VRWSKDGNPWYPLPPNYEQLDEVGQRLARMNVFQIAVGPEGTPEDLVYAWALFRNHYLMPKSAAKWFKRFKESPPMHYQLIHDMGQYSKNALAAPRSFAKSTLCNEAAMLLALVKEDYDIELIRATASKSRKNMSRIKRQLEDNELIKADFGELAPPRGKRTWSTERLELPNGSTIEGTSVKSALRGDRPDLIIVDDPEYDEDEEKEGRAMELLEDFEVLLFQTMLGMLDDGTGLFWIGTQISRRSFLYHLNTGDDPRFEGWNRKVLAVCEMQNGKVVPGSLVWEAKWDAQAVYDRMATLGTSAFNAEMMNAPGSGKEKTLYLHPQLGVYRVEGPPPEKARDPFSSPAEIRFHEGVRHEDGDLDFVEKVEPFGAWARSLYRVALVDYAPTISPASDYSCVQVLGFDRTDTLWVLDGFLGKVRSDALQRIIWDLAYRWKVRAIGVEAVSVQKHLADRIAFDLAKVAEGTGYIPRVVPIKYPARESKGERICGLEWRFNQFRIKYPIHRKNEFWVSQLWFQTENFTPDLTLLRHDDAIDTVAMHQYLVRRSGASRTHQQENVKTAADYLQQGVTHDEKTGIPYITAVELDQLTDAVLEALAKRRQAVMDGTDDEEVPAWMPRVAVL